MNGSSFRYPQELLQETLFVGTPFIDVLFLERSIGFQVSKKSFIVLSIIQNFIDSK